MQLASARALKEEITSGFSAAGLPLPFAIGITLPGLTRQYRLALLLSSIGNRRHLESLRLRRLRATAGREIDIEVAGEAVGASGDGVANHGPLAIGASIGHVKGGDGSVGFFARDRASGRRGLVSCSHVLGLADRGAGGDVIVAPSTLHGGVPADRIGTLDARYPRLGSGSRNLTDCAFAFLDDGIPHDSSTVDGGALRSTFAQALERLEVTKIGAATGVRKGIVDRIEVDNLPVRYGGIKAFFNDVIQIGAATQRSFAQGGDSGALVYATQTLEPVGLVFATSIAGGPHDAGWTWAHPIDRVAASLGVDIVVD
ncbi:MAG TPA: hypothetical protein VHX14_16085 [Thermoanaerobaculia bacterium]|jgi:hypothetical protein|nr:hypothetical protein [Thermoanaerobaculia bacterium]